MGRGDRSGLCPARGSGKQVGPPIGEPSPRRLADEAESLQQQGERRKGLEAASKLDAAAIKYQQALDAVVRQRQLSGLGLTPPDEAAGISERARSSELATLDDAVEMRSNLAECLQLLGEALLEAAATSPDDQLSPALERQAFISALTHQLSAAGHYACCHPAAVLAAPPQAHQGAEAGLPAAAGSGSSINSSGDVLPAAVIWAANTAAEAMATAASSATLATDVAVNAGNCLSSLADSFEGEAERLAEADRSGGGGGGGVAAAAAAAASPPTAWLPLYDSTLRCYRSAVACYRLAVAQEEDALTLGNLGDVLVQSGTCLYSVGRAITASAHDAAAAALGAVGTRGAGGAAAATAPQGPSPVEWAATRETEAAADFAEALHVYEAACALSDSEQGDDLPGLLCNWGAGLLSMAGCLKDPAARLPLLEQAAARLAHAASFDRGDPAPLVSLGDVLAAASEASEALATAAAEAASTGDGSTSVSASAAIQWYGKATGHMQAALDRGYGAALRLRRDEPEALVGSGEAHLALARLAHRTAAAGGGSSGADEAAGAGAGVNHATAAVAALRAALYRPERLGAWQQRCDVRYNLACALALAGREQEAHQLFSALLACGGISASELVEDADLAPVRHLAWFQALIQS